MGFALTGLSLFLLNQALPLKVQKAIAGISCIFLVPAAFCTATGFWFGAGQGEHSLQSALAMIAFAAGIWFISSNQPKVRERAQYIGLSVGCLAMLGISGFAYNYPLLYHFGFPSSLGLPSAFVLLLLSMSLFFCRTDSGPAAIVVSRSLTGIVTRRLSPLIFLTPALGLVARMEGHHSTAVLFLLFAATVGLPVLIYLVANALSRAEEEKNEAYSQVQMLNQQLNKQVDELLASQNQISEALRARSEFLAKVSHELRTPLSGIIGTNELLLTTALKIDQRELAKIGLDSANTLLTLINEILDFSKIDARKLQIESIPMDVIRVVETAVYSMQLKAHKKNIPLLCFISPDVPRCIKGDPGRLRQIIVNLIDNAIKFTEHGKVLVQLSLEQTSEQKMICCCVTDTGIGISKEQGERLFQPFIQADGSMTRRYGGTGLGLSICKSLVELMRGEIGLQSSYGKGSTFWFVIPAVEGAPGEEQPINDTSDQQKITTADAGCRILLVEDNPVNARLTILQLKRLGYGTQHASNGREAITALQTSRFALILMDIQMPDMDGFEATHIIRERERHSGERVPIIAITAHAMPGDREKCLEAGMDEYITKPLSLEILAKVIKDWRLTQKALTNTALI